MQVPSFHFLLFESGKVCDDENLDTEFILRLAFVDLTKNCKCEDNLIFKPQTRKIKQFLAWFQYSNYYAKFI